MQKGVAKGKVAEQWLDSTGEGVSFEEDEATCVEVHEAMGQAMNVWSVFSGRVGQVECCWAADYADA
eukprot:989678-Lingulodinium_polyedra.AAC.1